MLTNRACRVPSKIFPIIHALKSTQTFGGNICISTIQTRAGVARRQTEITSAPPKPFRIWTERRARELLYSHEGVRICCDQTPLDPTRTLCMRSTVVREIQRVVAQCDFYRLFLFVFLLLVHTAPL